MRSLVACLALWLPASALALNGPRLPPDAIVGPKLPDDAPAQLSVSLRVTDQAALDQLLQDLQNPASPSFHRWLTPQEFGERFGQAGEDYEHVARWLEAAGFTVTRWPNRLYLNAAGNVRGVRRLLKVEPHEVTQWGQKFRTILGKPELPADLDARVVAIGGLDTRHRWRHHIADPTAYTGNAFGPQDWRTFYDFAALTGATGGASGAQLAVIATQVSSDGVTEIEPTAANIDAYIALAGGTVLYNPILLSNTGDDFDTGADFDNEYELDSEMQSVAAPNAADINVVLAPASTVWTDATNYIVNDLSTVVAASASLGTCEPNLAGDDLSSFTNLFNQGLAEGIAWFTSAGDFGANGCEVNDMGGGVLATNWPCTMPQVVCVGGTQVEAAPAWDATTGDLDAWQAESVWNEYSLYPGYQGGAGGGGVSTLYGKPTWQQGVSPSDGARDVPDISFMSSAATPGTALYDDTDGSTELATIGGTSVAAPLSAGIFTLISTTIGCRLGDIHALLYELGEEELDGGFAGPFHDVTVGNNDYPPVTGYSAGPGYDLATGWGSLDVAQFISVVNCSSTTSSTTGTVTGTTSGGTTSSGTTGGATTGSAVGTTSGATGSTSGFNGCSPSTATVSNGDQGTACTGSIDGGAAQGSCASGEYCLDLFQNNAPRCWEPCNSGPPYCTGTAICFNLGTTSQPDDLCLPDCLPSSGFCPDGLSCWPITPDPNEAGYCYESCTASSECNSSAATHNVCTSGSCRCTVAGDCPAGELCDAVSGACYTDCSGTCVADTGCCAIEGSLDYCDIEGLQSSSSTTTGTTSASATAAAATSSSSTTAAAATAGTSSSTTATATSTNTGGSTSTVTAGSASATGVAAASSGSSGVTGTPTSASGSPSATAGASTGHSGGASTTAGSGAGASTGSSGTGSGSSGAAAATGTTTFSTPPPASSGGCSCNTGNAGASWLPLLGLVLLRRKRYQRRA